MYLSLLNLVNIELNHKVACVEIREKFFFNKESLYEFNKFLKNNEYFKRVINGVFVLSTCNRTSLFLDINNCVDNIFCPEYTIDIQELIDNLNLRDLREYLFIKKGLAAVENLLRISCGLESQVFAETDIVRQIKEYYKYCKSYGLLTPFLESLINSILHYSKEFDYNIRSKFNDLRSNFASVILNFIKKSDYENLNLLFIGLGNVNRQIISLLLNDNKLLKILNNIFVVSNYYDKYFDKDVAKFKEKINFEFYKKEELSNVLNKWGNYLDFIIVNTKDIALNYNDLSYISKKIIIFDLGLPRSVDPLISKLPNFEIIDLDKLKEIFNKFYFSKDTFYLSNDIEANIEFFIKSKVKEFYYYIVSKCLDKRLSEFYKEMYQIKEQVINKVNEFKGNLGPDFWIEKYIKNLIFRISKKHKEFLFLTNNTGIFRKKVVIGTRGSKLALEQTKKVLDLLRLFFPDIDFYVKIIKTSGDKNIYTNNSFVKEIEEALISEEIDIAVNSLKDMPYSINPLTNIVAVLKREEANDVLVSKDGKSFWELPKLSVIGTSSLRRIEQLKRLRNELVFKEISGNVDTRIKKMNELGIYDAIVLAKAAISRLNLNHLISYEFSVNEVVPAVGQGVIALQTRKNSYLNKLLFKINDIKTFIEISIERAIMGYLKLGCRNPLGLYVSINNNSIDLYYFFMLDDNIFKGVKSLDIMDFGLNFTKDKIDFYLYKDQRFLEFIDELKEISNKVAQTFIKEIISFTPKIL